MAVFLSMAGICVTIYGIVLIRAYLRRWPDMMPGVQQVMRTAQGVHVGGCHPWKVYREDVLRRCIEKM